MYKNSSLDLISYVGLNNFGICLISFIQRIAIYDQLNIFSNLAKMWKSAQCSGRNLLIAHWMGSTTHEYNKICF